MAHRSMCPCRHRHEGAHHSQILDTLGCPVLLAAFRVARWRRAGSNRSTIGLDRKCYLCPRNELLPMCPEWTGEVGSPHWTISATGSSVPPDLLQTVTGRRGYANSLNGLKTLSPGRLKSRSFPVAIVRPCRRAVAAM